MRSFPGAVDEEESEALEGKGGAGRSDVGSAPHFSLRASGPWLGEDLEAYVLRPAMRDHMVQCRISRDKRGVDKGMFPFYYLYLEAAEGQKVRFGSLGSKPHLPGASPAPCCVRSSLSRMQALLTTELGPSQVGPLSSPTPKPTLHRTRLLVEPSGIGPTHLITKPCPLWRWVRLSQSQATSSQNLQRYWPHALQTKLPPFTDLIEVLAPSL